MKPPPTTLPTATRAWCLRDPLTAAGHITHSSPILLRTPRERPKRFIALHTESAETTTTLAQGFEGERRAADGQGLFFGCAVIGETRNWRVRREVIFYPDDLPRADLAVLRQYINDRTFPRGARPRNEGDPAPDLIWRDERRVVAQLLPLSRFLKLFYLVAHADRELVVGFDLASHLSRLATDWHEVKKGANVGAWHLDLCTYRVAPTGKIRPDRWRPGIIINRKTADVVFIEFAGYYRGEFLDPANLARGLTGRHWTLSEALAAFTGEVMDKATEPCRLTCDALDHCRAKLRGTLSLTGTLIELFDQLHPVSRGARGRLSETHVYSPGGLARSYLDAAGFSAPTVPEDRLGPCAGALFGPWAEVQVRDRLPLVHVDFRRDYQTVFLLQRLQDLLAAERLEFVDDTQAVRAFVDSHRRQSTGPSDIPAA